jgi:hypothetical protein
MKPSEYPRRLVCRTLVPVLGAVVALSVGATAGYAAKAPGRDPAEAIRGTTVVGQSGVPAPLPPPSALGEEVEKEARTGKGRSTSELSPGLAKARRVADQKRRTRDAKEGRKRPVAPIDDNDDVDEEGRPGKKK